MKEYKEYEEKPLAACEPVVAYGAACAEPTVGTRMMISPYLTHKNEWVSGDLIEVEHNSFRGLVYVVKTDAGEIFFSVAEDFKRC